jgi:streptogramin lyase
MVVLQGEVMEKTFYVTRASQVLYAILFLCMFAIVCCTVYFFFSYTSPFGYLNVSSLLFFIFLFPPLILLTIQTVYFGVSFIASRKTRLIFESKLLIFESLNNPNFFLRPGWHSFKLSYDQIKVVKVVGAARSIEIFDFNEKKFVIFPALFSKNQGGEVFTELKKRLSPQVFESGFEFSEIPQRWVKRRKIINLFLTPVFLIYILTFFFESSLFRDWSTNAWQVKNQNFRYENTRLYSVDSYNNFWITASISGGYHVYRFSDKMDAEWWLSDSILQKHYPLLSSADKAGRPIVWLDNGVLLFDNSDWKSIPYKNGLTLGAWDLRGVALGEESWGIANQDGVNHLLKINALSGEWAALPIPETAEHKKLSPTSVSRISNTDILVLMQGNTEASVFILSNGEWVSQEFPIIILEGSRIHDYFLDTKSSLWVLLEVQNSFIIEKVNPNGELQLTQLPSPQEEDDWDYYDHLVVDSSERLWVSGEYPFFMAVFTPVWEGEAVEVVRYTENNSNYESDSFTKPIISSDGQLWSFGRRITKIDTNLSVLPSPLPEWFASWDWDQIKIFIGIILLFSVVSDLLISSHLSSAKTGS